MSTAAFFIQTPFEMICAINALHHYDINVFKFYIIDDGQERFSQLTNMANQFGIDFCVLPFEFLVRGGLKRAVFESLFCRNGNYDLVFTGDYRAALKDLYIIPFIGKRGKIVKLDDGNCTIDMLTDNDSVISSDIKRSRWWLNLVCTHKHIDIIYYTVFDKLINEKYRLEVNDMKFLQSHVDSSEMSNEVLFIGTNPEAYVEALGISVDVYFTFIRKIFLLLREKMMPIKYILHGRDINPRTKVMCEEFGVECIKPKECIEVFILNGRYNPRLIYGLTSTALFSLRKILLNAEIVNIVPDISDIAADSLLEISNYYELNGISTLKIGIDA